MGGMHGGSDRKYVVKELDVRTVNRDHPINAGVDLKRLDDEYYYRLKFAKQGKVTPLLETTIDGNAETIAWAFERPDGGRSFGFGGMHYHKNWQIARLPPPRRPRHPLDPQAAGPQSGPAGRGHGRGFEDPRGTVGRSTDI